MRLMEINRRQFIALGAGAVLLGPTLILAQDKTQRLLSCRSDASDKHFFSVAEIDNKKIINIPLPARGHGIAVDKHQHYAAVFARRPGDFVYIVDLQDCRVTHKLAATPGRHFNGHGLYSDDGDHLLCSENDFETSSGIIGVYDVKNNYQRITEFPSYGLDPHEFKVLSNGKTLVIANGGILTHPDLPRIKQNLATMRPNLAYVDIASGQLLHKHEPMQAWHQLSIRHIDVSATDQVAIAMQFEGRPTVLPPLIATQQGEQSMVMLKAPDDVHRRLHNYCGSVTFSKNSQRFAVSSPRGGVVTFWSAEGEYLGVHDQSDACGIARAGGTPDGFLISDGTGKVMQVDSNLSAVQQNNFSDSRWDNHLLSLS